MNTATINFFEIKFHQELPQQQKAQPFLKRFFSKILEKARSEI